MPQLTAVLYLVLIAAFIIERIMHWRMNKDIDDFVKELHEKNKQDPGDKKGE